MCGKFTQRYTWQQVHAYLRHWTEAPELPLERETTVTPMRFASVLHLSDGLPAFAPMRWGFAAKNDAVPDRPRHMHARAETVEALPAFAEAFADRRCVLLVDTFNEGEEVGSRTVQWTITPKGGELIAIAGIHEEWVRGDVTLPTFVMVTTPPNPLIGRITDRMPAVLQAEHMAAWFEGDAPTAHALLRMHDDAGAWDMERQAGSKPPKKSQGDLFG